MSDHDRLADYFNRLENDDYRRTLTDGCDNCGHSSVFCRAVAWVSSAVPPTRCCPTCSH